MASLFKNQILVFSAMQYGYLNPEIMIYKNELSVEARDLLKDIEKLQQKYIAKQERHSLIQNQNLWKYIRPDYQNVYNKIHMESLKNQFYTRKDLIINLNIDQTRVPITQVRELLSKSKYNDDYHRDISNIESIIINDFFYDGTSLKDYKKHELECSDTSGNILVPNA